MQGDPDGGGPGNGFDVDVLVLHTLSGRVHTDSVEVSTAVGAGIEGAEAAGGACGGGPLAEALERWAGALGAKGFSLVGDVSTIGENLATSASVYAETDRAIAARVRAGEAAVGGSGPLLAGSRPGDGAQ